MIKLLENVNVTYISLIEDLILNVQLKDDVNDNLNKIKNALNKSFDKGICEDISISDNNGNTLYGMRVYPSVSSLEKISQLVMDPKVDTKELTKKINNMDRISYIIEIDSNLLYNRIYNFKADEITAILLHEIGHVVADSDFYNDLKTYYNEALFSLDNIDLSQAKMNKDDIKVGTLFLLSAIEKTRIQYHANNNVELEKVADKFVVKAGYGNSLVSAMKKFNKIYLTQYNRAKKDASLKSDAEAFAHLNSVFKTRTNYVLSILNAEEKATNSNLVKKVINDVKKYITGRKLNESLNVTVPVYLMDKEFINEGFLSKWLSNPLKISQMDIDDLKIEAEMMEDYDDKSILVFKIHKRINQINKTLEKSDNDNVNAIANGYLNQLNELLKNVMKFNATPKRYGVFIKYPKGYEG